MKQELNEKTSKNLSSDPEFKAAVTDYLKTAVSALKSAPQPFHSIPQPSQEELVQERKNIYLRNVATEMCTMYFRLHGTLPDQQALESWLNQSEQLYDWIIAKYPITQYPLMPVIQH